MSARKALKPVVWWAVKPIGKATLSRVERTKSDASDGFRYMLEIGQCELIRVRITEAAT